MTDEEFQAKYPNRRQVQEVLTEYFRQFPLRDRRAEELKRLGYDVRVSGGHWLGPDFIPIFLSATKQIVNDWRMNHNKSAEPQEA